MCSSQCYAGVLAFISTILSSTMFYGKNSHHLLVVAGLSACVDIGLNMLLVPRFGMVGAAYATLIGMAGYACLVFVISQKVYQIECHGRKIVSMVVMSL